MLLKACLFVFCLSLIHANDGAATYRSGTVYISKNKPIFRSGIMDKINGAAYGYYNATIQTTGWGVLEIHAGAGQKDLKSEDYILAAGYLEGVLTANDINTNAINMRRFWSGKLEGSNMDYINNWLLEQDGWVRNYVKTNQEKALPRVTGYLMKQFDGMLMGVQDTLGSNRFNKSDLLILVNTGDLIDLSNIRAPSVPYHLMTQDEIRRHVWLTGMCSALVKVLPGLENIFMSHVSWFTYSATLRIYKHYNFDINDSSFASGKLSFSSYAGYLTSLDDFYILGSKMVILQTTNNIFNKSLYASVKTSSLLSWQRIRAANHMARNGNEWANVVATLNSGTYNNQYMVIDLKRVHLNERIDDKALTIVEQIPGLVEYSDQTPILRNGHWPSYNVPFHEKIYNLSGYPDFVRQHGTEFSYQMAPRAKLFRRDAGKVASIEDMKRLMRSNNYKHDPYSHGNPAAAICARGDLSTGSPAADGCYDGKVADVHMALNMQSTAISGPTTAGGTLPQFTWSVKPFASQPHKGLPNTYNFNWTTMRPLLW